jgi:hypothetical protein
MHLTAVPEQNYETSSNADYHFNTGIKLLTQGCKKAQACQQEYLTSALISMRTSMIYL